LPYKRTAICFLVINQMLDLPEMTVRSVLQKCDEDIFVGYISEKDLQSLPKSNRIHFIKLDDSASSFKGSSSSDYMDFATDAFYQIVQYKWQLINLILDQEYEFVLYTDSDVYWNQNPVPVIEKAFDIRVNVDMQVQSFSDDLAYPKLCMGFVAFRNNSRIKHFLQECLEVHMDLAQKNPRIGDDDVATSYYIENGMPAWIAELPQTTFPVGRMMNLYSTFSAYPGMGAPTPFIFHANFVVGLKNKRNLLRLFIQKFSSQDSKFLLDFDLYVFLGLKRTRYAVASLRKLLSSILNLNK